MASEGFHGASRKLSYRQRGPLRGVCLQEKAWIPGRAVLVWGMISPHARVMDWNHEFLWCVCGWPVLCFWSNIFMFYVITKNNFHPSCIFVPFVDQWDLHPNAVNPSSRILCFCVDQMDLNPCPCCFRLWLLWRLWTGLVLQYDASVRIHPVSYPLSPFARREERFLWLCLHRLLKLFLYFYSENEGPRPKTLPSTHAVTRSEHAVDESPIYGFV